MRCLLACSVSSYLVPTQGMPYLAVRHRLLSYQGDPAFSQAILFTVVFCRTVPALDLPLTHVLALRWLRHLTLDHPRQRGASVSMAVKSIASWVRTLTFASQGPSPCPGASAAAPSRRAGSLVASTLLRAPSALVRAMPCQWHRHFRLGPLQGLATQMSNEATCRALWVSTGRLAVMRTKGRRARPGHRWNPPHPQRAVFAPQPRSD